MKKMAFGILGIILMAWVGFPAMAADTLILGAVVLYLVEPPITGSIANAAWKWVLRTLMPKGV